MVHGGSIVSIRILRIKMEFIRLQKVLLMGLCQDRWHTMEATISMDHFALRWSFLGSHFTSYGSKGYMACDGGSHSKWFILHCDGVEVVRERVSYG